MENTGNPTPSSEVSDSPSREDDTDATPLLSSQTVQTRPTPLPYAPIIALFLGRIAVGMLFSMIFPYVNEMVHEMGVPNEDVGKWSATAETAMLITATIAGPIWGHLGDKYGRRKMYLLSLTGWPVMTVVFGLQRTLPGVIICRAILGALEGPGVLSRTMMGEITDTSNAVKGFALFSPAVVIGVTLGPVIGGTFARPVPNIISDKWTLFVRYPYLLPAIVVGGFSLVVIAVTAAFVPETGKLGAPNNAIARAADDEETDVEAEPLLIRVTTAPDAPDVQNVTSNATTKDSPVKILLSHRPFQIMLLFFAITSPLMTAFSAVFPLFAYTPPDLGGLGLSVRTTGYILGAVAVFSILMTIFIFPPLHARLGTPGCLLLCKMCHLVAPLIYPLIYNSNLSQSVGSSGKAAGLMAIHFGLVKVGDFAGTLLDASVRGSLESDDHLGLANAIIFSVRQISRAPGIYAIAALFSYSASSDVETVGREVWWIAFAAANVPALWLVYDTQYKRR